MPTHTKIDKMIAAAFALTTDGKSVFTAEDLVARSFELFPEDFCLPGYPQYPNSNAIYTKIMGKSSPLVANGYLEKVGTQKFRITPKASAKVEGMGEVVGATSRMMSERERTEGLGRLFNTMAWKLNRAGELESVTFYQFCRFYDIPTRESKWQAISTRLKSVAHIIEEAVRIGEGGEPVYAPRQGSRFASPDDVRELGALHKALLGRFATEVADWKARLGGA